MVPVLSIIFMAISIVLMLAIPAVLFLYFRKKYGTKGIAFFVGAAVMLVFAFILEGLVNKAIFASSLGEKITASPILYALVGGFMAGLFEETGRFTAFKTVLRKHRGNDHNALMYGAGHGGFEAVAVLVPTMINNITYSVMMNKGTLDAALAALPGEAAAQLSAAASQLASNPPWVFLVGAAERVAAIALQIALSVLVWFAAKRGGKSTWLYVLAIAVHMAVDAVAVFMSLSGINALVTELAVYILSAAAVLLAVWVWKRNKPATAE